MANVRYNHAYTHCCGKNCDLKDDCVHYLSYLEALDLKLPNIQTCDHCESLETGYVRVRIEK